MGPRARRLTGVASAIAAALACVQVCLAPASAATVAGGRGALPVGAHGAGGGLARLRRGARRPVACVSEAGFAASESTIALTSRGTLVYSPAQTENSMARSTDGGAIEFSVCAGEN